MIGTMLSRGLMLAASILVARALGKARYGELGIVQSTVGMFGTFAGFGLGMTATKYVAECHRSDPGRAGRIIALSGLAAMVTGALMALSLIGSAQWLAEHTINAPRLAGVLRLSALILFFSAVGGAQTGALAGFEAFKTIAQIDIVVGVIAFPLLVGGAYLGGVAGTVWALAAALSLSCLLSQIALRARSRHSHVTLSFRGCKREVPILWQFSLPAVLAGAMVGPVNWACSALLVNRPDGYSEMAILSVANQWYAVMLFVPSVLGQVMLPVLAERLGRNDGSQAAAIMVLTIKATAVLVFPLVFAACIASPYIMSLYGEGFRSGWKTLVVVLLTTGLLAVLTPVGQVIAASGRMWIGFMMNLAWAGVVVSATLAFVDRGSLGVAVAKALGYVCHAIWTFGFAVFLIRASAPNRAA